MMDLVSHEAPDQYSKLSKMNVAKNEVIQEDTEIFGNYRMQQ